VKCQLAVLLLMLLPSPMLCVQSNIGKGLNEAAKRVIPVTYDRLGLFCLNFDWEPKSEAATVN
jgi:hypothetical protein